MAPRLIATDVDGTLLTSERTISPRTLAAFEAAQAAGVTMYLTGARHFFH